MIVEILGFITGLAFVYGIGKRHDYKCIVSDIKYINMELKSAYALKYHVIKLLERERENEY